MKKILSSLLLSTFIGLSAIAQMPTSGLVASYPFNGNANDESGNGHNGTVSGATLALDRFGKTNSAYSFDGNLDWISISSLTGNYTNASISFWFNNPVATAYYACYFTWDNMGWCNEGSWSPYKSGDFVIYPSNHGLMKLPFPSFNSWHHVVIDWDYVNKTGLIYLDGIKDSLINGSGWSSAFGSNASTFTIGNGTSHDSNSAFTGKIDDFRIYNRSLNESEVSALYNENITKCSITVTDTLVINANITGFNPITYQNNIKIYPNPTLDKITIDCGSNYNTLNNYTIKISNSLSQTVYESLVNKQTETIDMNLWTGKGIYFVHLIDANSNTIEIKKIVLQ